MHANIGPEDRFSRLLMMLEAQFGSNIAPIERPRMAFKGVSKNGDCNTPDQTSKIDEVAYDDNVFKDEAEAAELSRLHALGIPLPGIEIQVDKHVARVWLEDLDVECSYPVLRDRVRVVIERAVETVASMWAGSDTTAFSSSTQLTNGNGVAGKSSFLEGKSGVDVEAKA